MGKAVEFPHCIQALTISSCVFFLRGVGGGGNFLWCCQYLKDVVSDDKLIKELERIWKEMVMA
jgi:hypothetical protein